MKNKKIVSYGWLALTFVISLVCWVLLAAVFAPVHGWTKALIVGAFGLALPMISDTSSLLARTPQDHRYVQWERFIGMTLTMIGAFVSYSWLGAIDSASKTAAFVLYLSGTFGFAILGGMCWGKFRSSFGEPPRLRAKRTVIPSDPSVN